MKYALLISIIFCLSTLAFGQKKSNPLLNTKWTFKGYLSNKDSTLEECPPNVNYKVESGEDHRVSGVASLVKIRGTYKMKKGHKVLIKLWMPMGSVPGHPDQVEFEWRLKFGRDLGMGKIAPYKIQGNQLKVFSRQYVTMLFELEK